MLTNTPRCMNKYKVRSLGYFFSWWWYKSRLEKSIKVVDNRMQEWIEIITLSHLCNNPQVVFIVKILNISFGIVIETLKFKLGPLNHDLEHPDLFIATSVVTFGRLKVYFGRPNFLANKPCFSKMVVTFLLLRIFVHRFLHWKLDFWRYNQSSIIFSFGLMKL